jgi:PAS domain S-box-containing protein
VRKGLRRSAKSQTSPAIIAQKQQQKHLPLAGTPYDQPLFRSLLENLEIGVAHADQEGNLLYANSRFAQILGHRFENLAGSNLQMFVAAASWPELCAALAESPRGATEGTMNVLSDGPGAVRVIRLSFSPLRNGPQTSIAVVATEVTELVQTEKALKQSEASLHSVSARMMQIQDEERRRLARDLHDTTGQELSIIIMNLDRMARDRAESAEENRKITADCAQRLRKVESDVRTLSYVLHPPLLDEMGLASALSWYLEGFSKRTGIDIESDIPGDLPRFAIEKETALFRVVQECLANVFRHSGSDRARVSLSAKSSALEAVVEDYGKGFTGEGLAGKPRSGVGIQSMKGRLEFVGGSFDLQSGPAGTRITAAVPLSADEVYSKTEVSERSQIPAQRQEDSGARKRILIADDHQVARRGIRMLFEDQSDLEICGEAADGAEALAKTRELNPDLVILDLTMPLMGGFAAANRIRNSGRLTKIIIYTSHSYPQLETMAHAAGCDGYVAKSDASHDLIRATRTVLAGGTFYRSEISKATSA